MLSANKRLMFATTTVCLNRDHLKPTQRAFQREKNLQNLISVEYKGVGHSALLGVVTWIFWSLDKMSFSQSCQPDLEIVKFPKATTHSWFTLK